MIFMAKFLAIMYILLQLAIIGVVIWVGYEIYTTGIHDFAMSIWHGFGNK